MQRQRVIAHDSVIYHPKANTVYYLKFPNAARYTIVTFHGAAMKQCRFIDLATGIYRSINDDLITVGGGNMLLLSTESLFNTPPRLPLYVYTAEHGICIPFRIKVTFQDGDINNVSLNYQSHPLVNQLQGLDNSRLREECQALVPKTPVQVGAYPIAFHTGKPTYHLLNELYQQFLKFNVDHKLNLQYQHSSGRCHIRAHFVNQLLACHGIASVKLFKHWHTADWQAYDKSRSWGFHCAAMVVDDQNQKWIWDPWVGLHKNLLTLNEWLYQKDEPTPIKCLIANSVVIVPQTNGNSAYGSRFEHLSEGYTNAFQAVCGDAIPNKTLLNRLGLFKKESKAIIKYEEPLSWLSHKSH